MCCSWDQKHIWCDVKAAVWKVNTAESLWKQKCDVTEPSCTSLKTFRNSKKKKETWKFLFFNFYFKNAEISFLCSNVLLKLELWLHVNMSWYVKCVFGHLSAGFPAFRDEQAHLPLDYRRKICGWKKSKWIEGSRSSRGRAEKERKYTQMMMPRGSEIQQISEVTNREEGRSETRGEQTEERK